MSIESVTVHQELTVNQENLAAIDWEENYFKWCHFEDFSIEGETICSDFVRCLFKNVDWYWGLFSDCNFIKCEFKDCVFQGSAFPDTRFVECTLSNCRFVKVNLDADCRFERAIAYACTIDGGEGFKAETR